MKLKRSLKNRNIFGVCIGISEYTGMNVTLIRLLFILGAIITGSLVVWIYFILSIVLPNSE